jgi:hypothetical protein
MVAMIENVCQKILQCPSIDLNEKRTRVANELRRNVRSTCQETPRSVQDTNPRGESRSLRNEGSDGIEQMRLDCWACGKSVPLNAENAMVIETTNGSFAAFCNGDCWSRFYETLTLERRREVGGLPLTQGDLKRGVAKFIDLGEMDNEKIASTLHVQIEFVRAIREDRLNPGLARSS